MRVRDKESVHSGAASNAHAHAPLRAHASHRLRRKRYLAAPTSAALTFTKIRDTPTTVSAPP